MSVHGTLSGDCGVSQSVELGQSNGMSRRLVQGPLLQVCLTAAAGLGTMGEGMEVHQCRLCLELCQGLSQWVVWGVEVWRSAKYRARVLWMACLDDLSGWLLWMAGFSCGLSFLQFLKLFF